MEANAITRDKTEKQRRQVTFSITSVLPNVSISLPSPHISDGGMVHSLRGNGVHWPQGNLDMVGERRDAELDYKRW
jgi:hypothetical protein